jgi:hypothetical protein
MQKTISRRAGALVFAALAALVLTACKTPSDQIPSSLVADSGFVIHEVHEYPTQNGEPYNTQIMLITVSYTNKDAIPQTLMPSKFILTDLTTLAQYHALDGGDVRIPAFQMTTLDPGKTTDFTVGFRVSMTTTSARLSYAP